jgi:hypothetical protein
LRCSANQHAKDAQAHALCEGSEGHHGSFFFHNSIILESWITVNPDDMSLRAVSVPSGRFVPAISG